MASPSAGQSLGRAQEREQLLGRGPLPAKAQGVEGREQVLGPRRMAAVCPQVTGQEMGRLARRDPAAPQGPGEPEQ
jgi:hypothetical protein